jgi:hypothetical protein
MVNNWLTKTEPANHGLNGLLEVDKGTQTGTKSHFREDKSPNICYYIHDR